MCKCTFFLLFFLGPKTARCLALLSAPLVSYKYVYCMCIFAIVNNLAFFFLSLACSVTENQAAAPLGAMIVYVALAGRAPRLQRCQAPGPASEA